MDLLRLLARDVVYLCLEANGDVGSPLSAGFLAIYILSAFFFKPSDHNNTNKMKRIVPLLLFLFSITCSQVIAQIQITADDAPVVGDVFVQSADTSVTLYSIGESGPNRVWDFRSLIANSSDTLRFIATEDAPKNDLFPDASFAGQIDSIYTFAQANDEGLYFLGIVSDFFDVDTFFALRFDPNPRLLAYPTTSTTAYVDTSKFDVTAFSDIFSDSVRITQEEFNHVNVDAFGTLRMPSGDFDVLRQERMVITFDTIEVLTNGVWFPIEQGVDTIFTYEWLAKEENYGCRFYF